MTTKSTMRYVISLLILVGMYGTVFARNPWLTATAVNGKTKPFSAGLDTPMQKIPLSKEIALMAALPGEVSGNCRDFDIVISYERKPNGDNDGDHQAENPAEWSTQDKIEKIIHYFADGIYEATEGAHRLLKKN